MMASCIDSWEEDSPRSDGEHSSTSPEPTSNVAVDDFTGGEKDYRCMYVRAITEEDLQNLSKSLVVLSDDDEVSEYEEVNVEEQGGERPLLYKVVTYEMACKLAQQLVVLNQSSEISELNIPSTSRLISHPSTGTEGSRSCCASTISISDSEGESIQPIFVGSHEQVETPNLSSKNNATKGMEVQKNEGAGKSASSKSKQSSTTTPGLSAGGALVKESKKKTQLERKIKSSPHESEESTAPSKRRRRRPRRFCTTSSSAGEEEQHDSDSSWSKSPTRKKRPTLPKVRVENSRRRTASARGKSSTNKRVSRTTKKATSEEIEANDAVPECQTVVAMMDTQRHTRCGIKTGISCEQLSSSKYPCRRCNREYYCSVEHQLADASRHKPFCKIDAQLEVIPFNEEYSYWLEHSAPLLYERCLNFVLVWPSLTVEWLTETVNIGPEPQLLLGTHTGDSEPNHLLICGVNLKKNDAHEGELHVLKRITHKGQIYRARHMPQDSSIIATKSPSKDVHVFFTHDFPEVAENDGFRTSLVLRGHSQGGFGLAWNIKERGILASGSNDGVICLWDICANPDTTPEPTIYLSSPRTVKASVKYTEHTSVVEDVAWNFFQPHVLASCGDDKKLIFWDIRTTTSAQTKENAHDGDINSVSLSPFIESLVLTGGSDKLVKIWDTRVLNDPVYTIQPFKDAVMNVQFSLYDNTFASAGDDGKVYIMSTTSCSSTSSSNESDDGSIPKEFEFIHSGHVSPIHEFSWSSGGMIASVSNDNILQIWEPARKADEDEDELFVPREDK